MVSPSESPAAPRPAVRSRPARPARPAGGFSLVELMITIAVLAVMVSAGLPEFTKFLRESKVRSLASDLRADVQFARSESIRRNARVLVCPRSTTISTVCATPVTAASWANGWLVCHDTIADDICDATTTDDPNPTRVRGGTILSSGIASPLSLSGPAALVKMLPSGNANALATFTMTSTGTTLTRTLTVAPSGNLTST